MSTRERSVWIVGVDGELRPGFYRTRLVKNGPLVPVVLAEIAPPIDQDGEPMWDFLYTLTVNGEPRCPYTHAPLSGEPVAEGEIAFMDATRQWAERHAPAEPEARPTERVDLRAIAPIF